MSVLINAHTTLFWGKNSKIILLSEEIWSKHMQIHAFFSWILPPKKFINVKIYLIVML